jgi:hypothetical protein
MVRYGYLLLYVLMVSLFVTATVHAQEFSVSPRLECSGVLHSEGDADQSQGDGDKAVPHHHSTCQATPMVVSSSDSVARPYDRATRILPIYISAITHRWQAGPGLRPPIA